MLGSMRCASDRANRKLSHIPLLVNKQTFLSHKLSGVNRCSRGLCSFEQPRTLPSCHNSTQRHSFCWTSLPCPFGREAEPGSRFSNHPFLAREALLEISPSTFWKRVGFWKIGFPCPNEPDFGRSGLCFRPPPSCVSDFNCSYSFSCLKSSLK